MRKTLELDLTLIDHYDKLLGEGDLYLTRPAKGHAVQPFARLPSVPGIGKILALVILYEIQDSARFPRVQDFVSSCRLVKCAKESTGKRHGLSGQTSGHPQLQWAFSEAAVPCLRQHQPGQEYFAQLERNHGQGKALTVLAQKLARAGYSMLLRDQPFELKRFVTA